MTDPRFAYIQQPVWQGSRVDQSMRNAVPEEVALSSTFAYLSSRIIDELQHQSWFYNNMPRIQIYDPIHNGYTLTYRFWRDVGISGSGRRDINETIDPTFTKYISEETTLANLSSAVVIDKLTKRFGGIVPQLEYQLSKAKTGMLDTFNEMVIRGDPKAAPKKDDFAVGPRSFTGLDKLIRGIGWHVWPETIDLTGIGDTAFFDVDQGRQRQTNAPYFETSQKIMSRLQILNPEPTFLLGNHNLISALSALGQRLGTYYVLQDQFGHIVRMIENTLLIPMGKRAGHPEEDIIPTYWTKDIPCRENPDKKNKTYVTRAYVGSFGPDSIMGLELPGDASSQVNFDGPIVVNDGYGERYNMEMFVGMVVHNRNSVGMFDNICIPEYLIEKPDYIDKRPAVGSV